MKSRQRVGTDREKVYFVVSLRDCDGNITYSLGDNYGEVPRWGRKVPYTSTLYQDRALELLKSLQMRQEVIPQ